MDHPWSLSLSECEMGFSGSAGVILLLWGPPPPSQQNPSSSDRTLAAQQAATAYMQTFEQVLAMPSALGGSQHALLLHSWGRFLARWGAAVKACQGRARGVQGGPAESAGEGDYALLITNVLNTRYTVAVHCQYRLKSDRYVAMPENWIKTSPLCP